METPEQQRRRERRESRDLSKTDEYGRSWGKRLWPGGPILGGENWQEFVRERDQISAEIASTRSRFL